jgi:hypothetical protein
MRDGGVPLCVINVRQMRDSDVPHFALGLDCCHAACEALRFADFGVARDSGLRSNSFIDGP